MNTRAIAQFDLAMEAVETVRLTAARSQTGKLIEACNKRGVNSMIFATEQLLHWVAVQEKSASEVDLDDWTKIGLQAECLYDAAYIYGDTSKAQERVWRMTDALERIVRRALIGDK